MSIAQKILDKIELAAQLGGITGGAYTKLMESYNPDSPGGKSITTGEAVGLGLDVAADVAKRAQVSVIISSNKLRKLAESAGFEVVDE